MSKRLLQSAFFAVLLVSLAFPPTTYASCSSTASGSLSNGERAELTCTGTSASASATLTNGTSSACGKLALWDDTAGVLLARQTGCGGSLSVSGSSVSGGTTTFLAVLTNQNGTTITYTLYIATP